MSKLTFTLIQTALAWEDREANLSLLGKKLRSLPGATQVAILPEMFTTGFSMKPELLAETMEGPTLAWMQELAAEKGIILTGSCMINEEGKYYNRMLWVLPNGHLGWYDKRHLFAYAGEDQHYTGGTERLITSIWR